MKLNRTLSSLSAISLFSLLLTTAYSHNGGWITDSSGNGIKDSSGKCIKSSGGNQIDGCGAPKPAPVVIAPPKPAPVVVAPAPRPRPVAPPAPRVHVLNLNESGGSNFKTGSARLSAGARATLDAFVSKVQSSGVTPSAVSIVGHTDSRGSKKSNQRLSERRAQAVADYLTRMGLNGNMQVSGMGESTPVASNKSKAGRAQNRRVDIQVNGQKRVTR
jgi:OOP family OmpA-OmpF porin